MAEGICTTGGGHWQTDGDGRMEGEWDGVVCTRGGCVSIPSRTKPEARVDAVGGSVEEGWTPSVCGRTESPSGRGQRGEDDAAAGSSQDGCCSARRTVSRVQVVCDGDAVGHGDVARDRTSVCSVSG